MNLVALGDIEGVGAVDGDALGIRDLPLRKERAGWVAFYDASVDLVEDVHVVAGVEYDPRRVGEGG